MNANLPYYTQKIVDSYRDVAHKERIKVLAEFFEESEHDIKRAKECEAFDEHMAFKAYQAMRAEREYDGDRDALLYHCDIG